MLTIYTCISISISKIPTKYNCDLEVFPVSGMKCRSLMKSHKISSREMLIYFSPCSAKATIFFPTFPRKSHFRVLGMS